MSGSTSPFGQNEWLVEEMYRKFREDPSTVDPSWHEFLADYSPEPATEAAPTDANGQPAVAAAAPVVVTTPAAAPTPPPAAPPAKPASAAVPTSDGDEVQVLRGAAAAVVKNM